MQIKSLSCFIVLCTAIMACRQNSREAAAEKTDTFIYSDTLGYDLAKRYVHKYSERAGFVERQSVRHPDTRCVWFSKGRLDSLITQLKKEGGDGVRFYLATYDTTYDDQEKTRVPHPPKHYWGYNTLVMVSTSDSVGYHRDYYNKKGSAHPLPGHGFIVVPENNGELCPPPANCNDIGATLIDN